MRYLLITILLIFIQCDITTQPSMTEITPDDLIGVWVRVADVQSDVPGLYKRDTIVYRIGLDPVVDTISGVYDKMAWSAHGRYTSYYGLLYRPWELQGENEFDYDLHVPYIRFYLRKRNTSGYEDWNIRFSNVRGYSKDTMDMIIGSETIGLKRKES